MPGAGRGGVPVSGEVGLTVILSGAKAPPTRSFAPLRMTLDPRNCRASPGVYEPIRAPTPAPRRPAVRPSTASSAPAAARSASFSCWTATWLFPCPRPEKPTATDVRSGQVIRIDFPRVAVRTVRSTPGQPLRPGARVVEGAIQPDQRHGERPALVRLERAVPPLPDRAQALDALVAHGDGLRPPAGHLVLLVDVLRDLPVRPGVRLGVVERLHPAFPGAAGPLLDDGIAPAGELGIIDGGGTGSGRSSGGRGGGGFCLRRCARAAVYDSPVFCMRPRTRRLKSLLAGMS